MIEYSRRSSVLHFLPRWDNGGMEHAVMDIINNFKSPTFEYTIFVGKLENSFGVSELQRNNVTFIASESSGDYSFYDVLHNFNRFMKHHHFDIVHCHINNSIGLVFVWLAKYHGANVVIAHTHNNSFGAGNLMLKKFLRSLSLMMFGRQPDIFFACSDEAGQWTFGKKIEEKNYHVIYNGIDISKFTYNIQARKELRERYDLNGKYIIGHIGHFNYQKNQQYLINLIPDFRENIKNYHLFLIGSGETKEKIKEQVNAMGADKEVTFIDPVNDIERYYSMFDLFILPSNFEGFGIVVIEAQAAGLNVICSTEVPTETNFSGQVCYLFLEEKH